MEREHWLIKSEPDEYSWECFLSDETGRWDGVRNYAARNNLRKMKKGDYALFYHTGKERRVVGVAEVKEEHYPDPTAEKGDFSAVDFRPVQALRETVSLRSIKDEPELAQMQLVKSPRLSVQSVRTEEFEKILRMGSTELRIK